MLIVDRDMSYVYIICQGRLLVAICSAPCNYVVVTRFGNHMLKQSIANTLLRVCISDTISWLHIYHYCRERLPFFSPCVGVILSLQNRTTIALLYNECYLHCLWCLTARHCTCEPFHRLVMCLKGERYLPFGLCWCINKYDYIGKIIINSSRSSHW